MKKAILLHNPTAGSGEHNKNGLLEKIESAGYEVKYYSTDFPGWELFTRHESDIIFVAGGDGTVQKLAKAMLETKEEKVLRVPVQIIPCGTANNIATTLKIKDSTQIFEDTHKKIGIDIGVVKGVEETNFFIEGMGCGIFPRLVHVMDSKEEDEKQDEIKQSLRELSRVVSSYEAQEAIIIADKEEITGKFLLVELMNIKYIGPNFELALNADPGDGKFELIIVYEDGREDLKSYVNDLLAGITPQKPLKNFAELRMVKEMRIKWKGKDVHIDDEKLETYSGEEIQVKNQKAVFNFLAPDKD